MRIVGGVMAPGVTKNVDIVRVSSRMLKKSPSGVLASLRGSTRVVRKSEALEGLIHSPRSICMVERPHEVMDVSPASLLAAALLDRHFEYPA
jgi:hypothetical protein